MPVLPALLFEADTSEKVRDALTVILAQNVQEQKRLCEVAGVPPEEWDVRVYQERANPLQFFMQDSDRPVAAINVWYEGSAFDISKSQKFGKQATGGAFNIDVVGYGVSQDGADSTHVPGDEAAAKAAQKIAKFVRVVLDSPINKGLGLPVGAVQRQWVASITMSEPQNNGDSAVHAIAARVRFEAAFFEFAPDAPENPICDFRVDILRASDGAILAQSRFNYGG